MRSEKINRRLTFALFTLALSLLAPAAAGAQEAAGEYQPQKYANLVWTLIGGLLVMFMQPGFTMVECGLVRAKNAVNILMKNYIDFAIGSLAFFLVGFGLMFGQSAGGIVGLSNFTFLSGLDGNSYDNQWTLTFWFFQSVFCGTSATIVSGAIAGRTRFSAYIFASILISAVIYPLSGHWVWNGLYGLSEGWLGAMGFVDFAGSTVVHAVGGWVGLAGAIVVGARLGKYGPDGQPRAIPGHNLSLTALGVFILWFGWFGFNCGSTNVADGTIGFIAVNTNLAACTGFVGAMVAVWLKTGRPDPSMSMNGVLAGLVGITAGCYDVSPLGAAVIGLISGVLVVFSVLFIDQKLKIDDPVGAASVHGVCGVFGTLAVGLFASPDYGSEAAGLFYGGGLGLLGVQALGTLTVSLWAFTGGLIVFKITKALVGARVSAADEIKGLDLAEHGTEAYSGFQFFTNN